MLGGKLGRGGRQGVWVFWREEGAKAAEQARSLRMIYDGGGHWRLGWLGRLLRLLLLLWPPVLLRGLPGLLLLRPRLRQLRLLRRQCQARALRRGLGRSLRLEAAGPLMRRLRCCWRPRG